MKQVIQRKELRSSRRKEKRFSTNQDESARSQGRLDYGKKRKSGDGEEAASHVWHLDCGLSKGWNEGAAHGFVETVGRHSGYSSCIGRRTDCVSNRIMGEGMAGD